MSFLTGDRGQKVCPKTGKVTGGKSKHLWLRWVFPITGLAALVWFLVRVLPKPSRAMYPCQRVAFPLASGFVVWVLGAFGSIAAFRRAKAAFARARYVIAVLCIISSVGFVWLAMSTGEQELILAYEPPVGNEPLGVGRGVNPGRVVWIHDADSTDWVYTDVEQSEHWYEHEHTNQEVVSRMLSKSLRALSDTTTDAAAWDAIFRYFNQQRGKGDVGYQPGEKIGIKINHTLSCGADPEIMDKNPWWGSNYMNFIDNSPQLTIALLRQLIDNAGVAPGDISIGDPGRIMPNYWYDMVEPNCPGVVYIARIGGMGRTASSWSNVEFYWSDPCSAHWTGVVEQDYIPTHFAEADYFINFPVLKSHGSGGVTACGKNFYGSLIRNPNGSASYGLPGPEPSTWYNMHITLPGAIDTFPGTPGLGHYRCLVDLMGHPELGGKTLLCLVDSLFSGIGWDGQPVEWNMSPFNGDWPSSIFVSQDQVAVDSVGFDFLYEEWDDYPHMSGAGDYLHEAALAFDPCSGTNYDPNDDGVGLASLGVHEHWNNSTDKQYSRNLDPWFGSGIELVTDTMIGDFDNDGGVDWADYTLLAGAFGTVAGGPGWNDAYDISGPSDGVIDEGDILIFCENWLEGSVPQLIESGATLQEVYYQPDKYFEGPSWDPVTGKLYFTNRTDSRILRLDGPGSATVWMDSAPGTNGTFLSNDGRLLTADENTKQIRSHRIGASGPQDSQVLAGPGDGIDKKPNDLCQLGNGNIYFTGPDWGAGPGDQGVYLLDTGGTVTKVKDGLYQPNGIIASNNEKYLYVAESSSNNNNLKRWWIYPIQYDGTLGDGQVFYNPSSPASYNDPDGMTIDELGNLYFVGFGGLWILSPEASLLAMVSIPEFCSNVTFGGPEGKRLYITCQDKVYSLAMRVRGGAWVDRTAPSPDPMAWAVAPEASGPYSISMTAETAGDKFGVEYYFANETDPSHDSNWQDSPYYNDTALQRDVVYSYRVKARDKSDAQNETSYSEAGSSTTEVETPPIAFDSNSFGFSSTAGNTLSWNHTIGAGQNRLLVVGVQSENPSASMPNLIITSVRYKGANLSKAGHTFIDEGGYALAVELWYLLEAGLPPSGTYPVIVTYSGTVESRTGGGISLENVLQASAEDVNSSTVTSSPISTSVTCSANAWVVDTVGCGNVSVFSPVGAGATQRYGVSATDNSGAGSTTIAGAAGPVTAEWSNDNANALAQVAASFRPLP